MSEITGRLSTALADRYKIESHLGEGGMANIYLAEDLKHNRKVAVKVLRPDLGAFTAAGAFGQFITVLPALDLVVAHKTAVSGTGVSGAPRTLFAEYRGVLERLAEAAVVPSG